jgi:hypothetical protein
MMSLLLVFHLMRRSSNIFKIANITCGHSGVNQVCHCQWIHVDAQCMYMYNNRQAYQYGFNILSKIFKKKLVYRKLRVSEKSLNFVSC